MIQSQPKSSSMVAIGLFLLGTLVVNIWLLVELLQNPGTFFLIKLILAPTLLVIGIIVAVKSYTSAMIITIGNNRLTYRHFLGPESTYKITEITSWQEEVVKRKDSEYRRLSIQLVDRKKLQLSNLENSNYERVVNYLKKKVNTGIH